MNEKRIGLGIVACTLGALLPVYHHIALHAAIAHENTSNAITRMQSVWNYLPWVDWIFLTLMWIVGLALILSGFTKSWPSSTRSAERRGFEVINVTDSDAKR